MSVVRRDHSPEEQSAIIRDVYRYVSDLVFFSDDDIGADLAYLFGSIVTGGFCAWPRSRPLVKLLLECKDRDVRQALNYVEIEG